MRIDLDKPHEECGVFGVAAGKGNTDDASYLTFLGLFALQHRGQESCGIATNNNREIACHKHLGLLMDVFDDATLSRLSGNAAIGHVRYSTTGDSVVENAQPIAVSHLKGHLAIAHNGNIVNAQALRREIEEDGGIFHSTSDSEIIAHSIVRDRTDKFTKRSIQEAIKETMHRIQGAYSLLAMSPSKMIAARDPNGFRPLSIGMLRGNYIFASETCAIDAVGGEFLRDVEPGEIVTVENGDLTSLDSGLARRPSLCSFEFIYFARPDSVIGGISVESARQEMGKALYKESHVDADIVVAVPDSGLSAAAGYAQASGLPNVSGLMKNRYMGRTFIQPSQGQRERDVRLKLNPVASNVKGKRIILIDDSIVRGTTSKHIVSALRNAGATEVHLRISAPPFLYPCYFGTDVPNRDRLIAAGHAGENNPNETVIAEALGANSLAYLSHSTLSRILLEDMHKKDPCCPSCPTCTACFSGNYPIELPPEFNAENRFEEPIPIRTITGK